MKKTDKNKENHIENDNLGNRLRFLRKNKGLSQIELSKKLGYKTSGSISNIEANRTPVDTETLCKLAEILDVDLHWLITGEVSPIAKAVEMAFKPYVLTHLNDRIAQWQDLLGEQLDLIEKQKAGEDHMQRLAELDEKIKSVSSYCDELLLNIKTNLNAVELKPELDIKLTPKQP